MQPPSVGSHRSRRCSRRNSQPFWLLPDRAASQRLPSPSAGSYKSLTYRFRRASDWRGWNSAWMRGCRAPWSSEIPFAAANRLLQPVGCTREQIHHDVLIRPCRCRRLAGWLSGLYRSVAGTSRRRHGSRSSRRGGSGLKGCFSSDDQRSKLKCQGYMSRVVVTIRKLDSVVAVEVGARGAWRIS